MGPHPHPLRLASGSPGAQCPLRRRVTEVVPPPHSLQRLFLSPFPPYRNNSVGGAVQAHAPSPRLGQAPVLLRGCGDADGAAALPGKLRGSRLRCRDRK